VTDEKQQSLTAAIFQTRVAISELLEFIFYFGLFKKSKIAPTATPIASPKATVAAVFPERNPKAAPRATPRAAHIPIPLPAMLFLAFIILLG
jgi:hypothetical protein